MNLGGKVQTRQSGAERPAIHGAPVAEAAKEVDVLARRLETLGLSSESRHLWAVSSSIDARCPWQDRIAPPHLLRNTPAEVFRGPEACHWLTSTSRFHVNPATARSTYDSENGFTVMQRSGKLFRPLPALDASHSPRFDPLSSVASRRGVSLQEVLPELMEEVDALAERLESVGLSSESVRVRGVRKNIEVLCQHWNGNVPPHLARAIPSKISSALACTSQRSEQQEAFVTTSQQFLGGHKTMEGVRPGQPEDGTHDHSPSEGTQQSFPPNLGTLAQAGSSIFLPGATPRSLYSNLDTHERATQGGRPYKHHLGVGQFASIPPPTDERVSNLSYLRI